MVVDKLGQCIVEAPMITIYVVVLDSHKNQLENPNFPTFNYELKHVYVQ